eukprot:3139331-Amphidinium_carterae.1
MSNLGRLGSDSFWSQCAADMTQAWGFSTLLLRRGWAPPSQAFHPACGRDCGLQLTLTLNRACGLESLQSSSRRYLKVLFKVEVAVTLKLSPKLKPKLKSLLP